VRDKWGGNPEEFGVWEKATSERTDARWDASPASSGRQARRNECTAMELKLILEAIVFSAEKPLSPKVLANCWPLPLSTATGQAFKNTRESVIVAALEELRKIHEAAQRSYRLSAWPAHGSSSASLSSRLGSSRCLASGRVRRGFPCPHWRPSPSSLSPAGDARSDRANPRRRHRRRHADALGAPVIEQTGRVEVMGAP